MWGLFCCMLHYFFSCLFVMFNKHSNMLYYYYFSKDCINWGLMPPATKEVKEKAKLAKGRFTGDPSHEFEHVEIKKVPGEGDEIHEEEETVIIPYCWFSRF